MLDHFPSVRWYRSYRWHPITPPTRFAALGRSESELVGRPWKALTRDATRRLRLANLYGVPRTLMLLPVEFVMLVPQLLFRKDFLFCPIQLPSHHVEITFSLCSRWLTWIWCSLEIMCWKTARSFPLWQGRQCCIRRCCNCWDAHQYMSLDKHCFGCNKFHTQRLWLILFCPWDDQERSLMC